MSAPAGSGDARERYKRQAAERAVEEVRSGMVVGLGGGTTAAFATRRLGVLLAAGQLRDVYGVPCSSAAAALAREVGVPLATLDEHPRVDLTIDGADEVDPRLDLIKGGGGALLHEKIVAQASRREVIVVDETKLSPALGTRFALPVEVVPFGWRAEAVHLESLGARVVLRPARGEPPAGAGPGGAPFRTDEGNFILDCSFGPIADPPALAAHLDARAGVVAHGLFLGVASEVVVAGAAGIRHLTPGTATAATGSPSAPGAPSGRRAPRGGPAPGRT